MINMRELTKKIAVAFGLLVFTAGFNIMDAQAGAALNFESGSPIDAVVLPQAISNNHLVGGTKITIEAWIRPTTLAGNGIIVSNYTTPNNQLQFLLRRDGSTILFLLGPGNVIASYSGISTAANTVTNTIWQHVAGVYDGTVASVYINGVLSASNTTSSNYTFASTTNSIIVGSNSISEVFDGDIDELRIWNTNRSKCEINTFMNCEIPSNATNLIANYHFNQGTAASNNTGETNLIDATSNAYNGTLNDFLLTGSTGNWVTPGGVVSSFTTAIPSISVTAVSSQSTVICAGEPVTLIASGATSYNWSTTAITPTITVSPSVTTTYTVTGTNTIGCQSMAIITQSVNACAGINTFNISEIGLEIYPNPSNGIFNIKASREMNIQVFDILGKALLFVNVQSSEYKLNLNEYGKGIYIVKCYSLGQVKSYKLIKE
jgi:hypothetical protein